MLLGAREGALHGSGLGHVDLDGLRRRVAPQLLGLGLERVAAAAHEGEPRPGAGERLGDGRADTAPAAGDDGVSALEAC